MIDTYAERDIHDPIHRVTAQTFHRITRAPVQLILGSYYNWRDMYYYLSSHHTYCIHCGWLEDATIAQHENIKGDPICEHCAIENV